MTRFLDLYHENGSKRPSTKTSMKSIADFNKGEAFICSIV